MAAYRFPILIWQDFANQYGACAVESPHDATAIGPTRGDVLDQLKDYLAWAYKKNPWRRAPEYQDSALTCSVSTLPFIRAHEICAITAQWINHAGWKPVNRHGWC